MGDNLGMRDKKVQTLKKGDLVRISRDNVFGIVTYQHPTKGVVRVHWPDVGFSWESNSRLDLIACS